MTIFFDTNFLAIIELRRSDIRRLSRLQCLSKSWILLPEFRETDPTSDKASFNLSARLLLPIEMRSLSKYKNASSSTHETLLNFTRVHYVRVNSNLGINRVTLPPPLKSLRFTRLWKIMTSNLFRGNNFCLGKKNKKINKRLRISKSFLFFWKICWRAQNRIFHSISQRLAKSSKIASRAVFEAFDLFVFHVTSAPTASPRSQEQPHKCSSFSYNFKN